MCNPDWEDPECVNVCDVEARPGYNSEKAHEYLDHEDVLKEKIKVLAEMLRQSKSAVIYSGAGISTSSGIKDYASKAGSLQKVHDQLLKKRTQLKGQGSLGQPKKKVNWLKAEPTFAHKTLTVLHQEGHIKQWVQQNHDGLPQKAGFPQADLNEIHGAWFDPSNTVVQFSGQLREDLFSDLLKWEQETDLCLCVGTSLSGMNADRMAVTPGL